MFCPFARKLKRAAHCPYGVNVSEAQSVVVHAHQGNQDQQIRRLRLTVSNTYSDPIEGAVYHQDMLDCANVYLRPGDVVQSHVHWESCLGALRQDGSFYSDRSGESQV